MMALSWAQLVMGMVVLLGSAEVLVRATVSLARMLGVPMIVIGMTVIAVGTSAPELVVSLNAALSGAPGLAVGNVVGSNIANVLLILGCCCLLAPIAESGNTHRRDVVVLGGGTAIFIALALTGALEWWAGAILMAAFLFFLASTYRQEVEAGPETAGTVQEVEEIEPWRLHPAILSVVVIAALAALIWGADLMVDASIDIARAFAISEEIIGLTVVALGTSLPELAASGVAAYRGQSDIAVGNVVGSNLFNILGIAGVTALVAPLPVIDRMASVDIWVMAASTALVLPILAGRWQPGRGAGIAMVVLYGAYIAYNAVDAGIFTSG